MRKLIIVCCALFVLAGCGTVAKEVTPQSEPKNTTSNPVTTNALVVHQPVARAVTENVFISGNVVVIDVSSAQTPVDALLASITTGQAEYELIPDGAVITVKLASMSDTVLCGNGEINQVYLTSATGVFVSVDPVEPMAYAAVETQPVTVVY